MGDTTKLFQKGSAGAFFNTNIMPTINRILEEPTTEYLPGILLESNYNFQILGNHTRTPNKKKVNELFHDLKKATPDYVEIDDNEYIENMDVDEPTNEEQEKISAALKSLTFEIDSKFKQVLKLHQIEGLQFMWDRVYQSKEGCLLAHSMGLGKSLQTIALLATMYQHLNRDPSTNHPTGKRVLLLAPLITLSNWVNEFQKWSVENSENIIGEVFNFSDASPQAGGRLSILKHWFREGGIMIMSYESYRNILSNQKVKGQVKEEYYSMLINPGPSVIILDEGHRIKNISSSITNLIYQVKTKLRICLTGYPLQNNLMEYYYMINFVAPNLLGSQENFKLSFTTAIENCYADSPPTKKEQAAVKLYVLQLLTSNVTHRRDESILKAELPEKNEYIVRFKMPQAQFEGYSKLVKYMAESDSPLISLIVLRALCNHPKVLEQLLKQRFDRNRNKALSKGLANEKEDMLIDDDEIDQEIISIPDNVVNNLSIDDSMTLTEEELLMKYSDATYDFMKPYFERSDIESWKCSGKMSFIADLAQSCHILKEKLVIVSHSLTCLDYIEQLLPIFGIKSLKISGSTIGTQRQETIDIFQKNASYGVILLSAKAAAIGINLTSANRIVLVDQDWNPLYDEQSIGRIYRYGQKEPVHVYRLVTASTIEERIFKQTLHKKSIFRRVIDNKSSPVISKEELTKYHALPSPNIHLINMEELDDQIKKDYIGRTVVRDNKDCIRSCTLYQEKNKNDLTASINSLSEFLRDTAKHEARKLYKNWKRTPAQQ